MTILLVDDDPASARLYGAAIQKRGFSVRLCHSGSDALELVRQQQRFRLIVSDVDMPGLSGHDMVRQMVSSGLRHCPILFLSATDMVDHVADGLRSGGDDFLIKGTPIDEMMDRVTFWLTSGFRCLPQRVRLNAIERLDQMNPTAPLLAGLMPDRAIIDAAFETLYREIQATDTDFGTRLVERIYIMGRADSLLYDRCDTPRHWLRFPDALTRIILKLRAPWTADIAVLMKYYDILSEDSRFQDAGRTDLVSIGESRKARRRAWSASQA